MPRELVAEPELNQAHPERAWNDPYYENQLPQYALATRALEVKATPGPSFDRASLPGLQPVQTLVAASGPRCRCSPA